MKHEFTKYILFVLLMFFASMAKAHDDWQVNPNLYEYSMTLTAVCQVGDSVVDETEKVVIGVFNTVGECVGKGNARYYRSVNKYRVPLLVYGNTNGEELELKAYFTEQNVIAEIDENIVFNANKSVGNFVDPEVLMITSFPVSVDEAETVSEFEVYPNPMSDVCTISVSQELISGNLYLMDQLGRTVMEQYIQSPQIQVNVAHLPKGLYLVMIRNEEKTLTQKVLRK